MDQPTTTTTPPPKTAPQEIGYAASINDYLIRIDGLPNVKINELVVTEKGERGQVIAITHDQVEVVMLDEANIAPRTLFRRTYEQLSIGVGPHLLGRTINPLGSPVDGKGRFANRGDLQPLDKPPLGIKARKKITRQFETGIGLVDTLVPIAHGQRELIIGDPRSGKTSWLIDLIVNQKDRNLVCVYAMIGKPVIEIRKLVEILDVNKAFSYTTVVAASSSERASLIYLAPSVALAIAEYFQQQGKDVLLILDDLGLHAKFYREISLLSGTAPGRESYPGDIFYQHAKLVERCGNFLPEYGGGSITALPVIETNLDDFSGYLPTNLMGMTDGHMLFSSSRYHQGHRPSVDVALSVTRVGRQTQLLVQKKLADRVKALLAEANKLEAFSRLGSELSPQTLATLNQSGQINAFLSQSHLSNIPIVVQMVLMGLTFTPFLSSKDVKFVEAKKELIIDFLIKNLDQAKTLKTIDSMTEEKQFIDSLGPLITALEKAVNTPGK